MRLGDFWLSKRRGSAVWCITWFDPTTRQTVRRSTGHRDLDAAQEALAAHYIQHRRLDHERPADVSIILLIGRYIATVPMRSTDTAKAALKHWREFWNDEPVSAMSTARQEAFHEWLQDRLAPSSVKRVLGVGRAALSRAYRRQELAALPAQAPYKAQERHRETVLSVDDLRRLWAAAQPVEHWRRYLWLAIGTGARPEAILQLTADRIDFAAGVIHLAAPGADHGKKRRPTIPMAQSLRREVKRWGDGYLVTYKGKPLARARESFKRLSRTAGVEATAYTIRHTVATWLRQRNVPEWDIAGFLGHRPPGSATTARYAHYRPDYMRAAARAVDALLRAVAC
ncbi:MAG: tyrosine-type recombinase/integrase [Reyranella sp.]|uniref:tyrosine-type recombinase/integrase n=1 Tax=Reyranella sp. TaxID=1929291 RepID=UPI003D14CBC7